MLVTPIGGALQIVRHPHEARRARYLLRVFRHEGEPPPEDLVVKLVYGIIFIADFPCRFGVPADEGVQAAVRHVYRSLVKVPEFKGNF